ncbi:MAG: hypothetical protein MRZ79_10370, partial [Bacteroidia bacterium]|nr:hypothetical protein [Bacteroidia bacterium]
KELGIEDEQIEYEEIGLEIVKIFNERVNSLNPAILHYLDYGSLLGNDEIDSVKLVLKEEGYSLGQNDSRFLDSVDNNVSDFLDEVILRYKNRIASIQISSYGYADNVPFRKKTLEKYNSDPVFNDIKSAICEWKDGQILCFEYLKFHKLKGKHNKKRNYILNLALANLRAENRLRKVKGGIDELSSGQLPFPITTKRAGIFEEYNSGKMFRKVELVITVRLKRIS